jgi:hypothetical protein
MAAEMNLSLAAAWFRTVEIAGEGIVCFGTRVDYSSTAPGPDKRIARNSEGLIL